MKNWLKSVFIGQKGELGSAQEIITSPRKWTTYGIANRREPVGHVELHDVQLQPYSFHWSHNIASVRVQNKNQTVYNRVFDSCKRMRWAVWKQGSNFSGVYLFGSCISLEWALIDIGTESAGTIPQYTFYDCENLRTVELGPNVRSLGTSSFNGCSALNTLILRRESGIVSLASTTVFSETPFESGGAGGVIYIPKALYNHLSDGGSLDYKAATNWAARADVIEWRQIEGSIYENATLEEIKGVA